MRACNDLGSGAAIAREVGYDVGLRDYQTERATCEDVWDDLARLNPRMVVISTTNATIYDDLAFVAKLRAYHDCFVVLKGAIFYDAPTRVIDELDLSHVDYLIGGEIDYCLVSIANHALRDEGDITAADGIYYKASDGAMTPTRFGCYHDTLDDLPFPARDLMNNDLYVRPDTGEPMATIQTSRGCSSGCVFCPSPLLSGTRIRYRSSENVLAELTECYEDYDIRNFFFKADTFTMNGEWARELCALIQTSPLAGKIAFTANSRSKPLDCATLQAMKDAGCWMIAFGFESGSDETLRRMCKGATVADNRQAMEWAREVGLSVFGFSLVGLPWETVDDLAKTRAHIFELDADFIEIHIALPYFGTPLYNLCREAGVLENQPLGADYFNSAITGTETLTLAYIEEWRAQVLRSYYLRPRYIIRRAIEMLCDPRKIAGYVRYGLRLL